MTTFADGRDARDLPLDLLDAPALASRAAMDDDKLDELARDIRRQGVIQPLIVTPTADRWEIVAGHRRARAARLAGVLVVPCVVYPTKSAALEAVKYAENRYREDLTAAEEAVWFAELLERDCGGDVDRLCEQLGEKRAYVEGRLLLLHGDEDVFRALERGAIAIGIAQQLNRCTEEKWRRYLLHQAITGGATVAMVAGWIDEWKRRAAAAGGAVLPDVSDPAPGAAVSSALFTCAVCQGTEHVHLMEHVVVHQYCRLAVLDKLLATYRGETSARG